MEASQESQAKTPNYGTVADIESSKYSATLAASETDTISISSDSSFPYSDYGPLPIGATEEDGLIPNASRHDTVGGKKKLTAASVARILSPLLLGMFISNADHSFLLATNAAIASQFGRLDDASWIITSYMLMCAIQPLYGKLSDIYGRKPLLLTAYFFFGLGCAYSGIAQTLVGVIIGRVISGIGGAGMMSLVSIVVTDIVPPREVAAWRAYVNIAATTGRSLGGPLGGYLTDTVGWRWSFLVQTPLIGVAGILVAFNLPNTIDKDIHKPHETARDKIARIDFLGSFLLSATILGTLLVLDMGGQKLPWSSKYIIGLAIISVVFLIAFILVELYVATEPVFPLHLLRNNAIATSYGSLCLSSVSQIGIMYSVPRYFQITEKSSATKAGAHLIPAVVGNVIGGIVTGISVKRTGRYKLNLIAAGVVAILASVLLIFRWNGDTNFWESLYIFPGGLGMGLSQAASFIAMTAGLEKEHYAVATSGLYLSSSIGAVAGVSLMSAVLENAIRTVLRQKLKGPGSAEIIEHAIKDVDYINSLHGHVRKIVVLSYVQALKYSYGVSLCGSTLAFVVGLLVKEKRLD